uniref:Uncharacterized protein n=1 Tax=Ciona intestinalis TaxID=7719 RepID=H2XNA3_CIOIN
MLDSVATRLCGCLGDFCEENSRSLIINDLRKHSIPERRVPVIEKLWKLQKASSLWSVMIRQIALSSRFDLDTILLQHHAFRSR